MEEDDKDPSLSALAGLRSQIGEVGPAAEHASVPDMPASGEQRTKSDLALDQAFTPTEPEPRSDEMPSPLELQEVTYGSLSLDELDSSAYDNSQLLSVRVVGTYCRQAYEVYFEQRASPKDVFGLQRVIIKTPLDNSIPEDKKRAHFQDLAFHVRAKLGGYFLIHAEHEDIPTAVREIDDTLEASIYLITNDLGHDWSEGSRNPNAPERRYCIGEDDIGGSDALFMDVFNEWNPYPVQGTPISMLREGVGYTARRLWAAAWGNSRYSSPIIPGSVSHEEVTGTVKYLQMHGFRDVTITRVNYFLKPGQELPSHPLPGKLVTPPPLPET